MSTRRKLTRKELSERNKKKEQDRLARESDSGLTRLDGKKQSEMLKRGKRLLELANGLEDKGSGIEEIIKGLKEDMELMEQTERWDVLEGYRQAASEQVAGISNEIAGLVGLDVIIPGTENETVKIIYYLPEDLKPQFNIVKDGYQRDLEYFVDEVLRISARHEGRTGTAVDHAELVEILRIHQEYGDFQDKVTSILLPSMHRMMHFAVAAKEEYFKASRLYEKQQRNLNKEVSENE